MEGALGTAKHVPQIDNASFFFFSVWAKFNPMVLILQRFQQMLAASN